MIFRSVFNFSKYLIGPSGEIVQSRNGKPIFIRTSKLGYLEVSLTDDRGSRFYTSVHRMVALAYIANPKNLATVNHKDGDKANNSVENLEWVSFKDNIQHSWRKGLRKNMVGEKSKVSVLDNNIVRRIRKERSRGLSYRRIAKLFGVGKTTVENVCLGRTWTHV